MSAPNTIEGKLLERSENILAKYAGNGVNQIEKRFQVLEQASAILGGFDPEMVFGKRYRSFDECSLLVAGELVASLKNLTFHPSLGLAALARPPLTEVERRTSGTYYTDFRLAQYLANLVKFKTRFLPILDPACGSAILLVAIVLKLSEGQKLKVNRLLKDYICGADQSSVALRGAFLSLASLTSDHKALKQLQMRLRRLDSLLCGSDAWLDIAPDGFGLVIGNPPWEKLKISRHEWLLGQGEHRHYGADYSSKHEHTNLDVAKGDMAKYLATIRKTFTLQGRGEFDLFKLFCELTFKLTAQSGQFALLVPAGLIRSQGTGSLREWLINQTSNVEIAVIENRARFFEIDTRFKFLAVHGTVGQLSSDSIKLLQTQATNEKVDTYRTVTISKGLLRKTRPDFTIPEVRTTEELKLFLDLCERGSAFGSPTGPWAPNFMREVDMTREKNHFKRAHQDNTYLPLIEGRMVHQYRYAAKRYVEGTGRRSIWKPTEYDDPQGIQSQFRFPNKALPDSVVKRVRRWRVGFCDITGQTNERTMLATRIPAGVVCGNKVPTIVFNEAPANESLAYCWLAIVNSFVFDWLLRRVVTTTVNYFLLEDLPFPKFDPLGSSEGQRLAKLSKSLSEGTSHNSWQKAEMRAEIEAVVLGLYGRDTRDMEIILQDFPLLDRAQPALPKEERSSITQDAVLLGTALRLNSVPHSRINRWKERVHAARELGAVPFFPSHLTQET